MVFIIKPHGSLFDFSLFTFYLNRKAGSAAAGLAGVGIAECKTPAIQAALPLYRHAIQVHFVSYINDAGNAFHIKFCISSLFVVKL